MDKPEDFFCIDELGGFIKVADFPCVLLNDPDSLTDSSKTAESLSENESV